MSVYVYVLINNVNDQRYVGMSEDVDERIKQHNYGSNKYTKQYRPWKLLFKESYPDRSSARKREKYLKSAAGRRFINKHYPRS